jgi:hypothetical protein
MTPSQTQKAIRSGLRMNERMGVLFADIGNSANPEGRIAALYSDARFAIIGALAGGAAISVIQGILDRLKRDIQREIAAIFNSSISLGAEEARWQLELYEASISGGINLTTEKDSALKAILARFDAQYAAILALLMVDASDEQIVGDDNRNGVFNGFEIMEAVAYWAAFLVWNAFDTVVANSATLPGSQIKNLFKMAVAVIDDRTTDCCLRVHGQIQPLDGMFRLTGTPRFADEMDYPAFHRYCRTGTVLYSPELDADGKQRAKLLDESKHQLKVREETKKKKAQRTG